MAGKKSARREEKRRLLDAEEHDSDADEEYGATGGSNSKTDDSVKLSPGDDGLDVKGKGAKAKEDGKGKDAKAKGEKSVSVFQLFRYAKPLDVLLIIVGSLVSIVTGTGYPFLSTIFGGLSNTFIYAQASIDQNRFYEHNHTAEAIENFTDISSGMVDYHLDAFMSESTQYCLSYAYVGFAVMAAGYIQMICWLTVCERQIYRIRQAFFQAILRQDIAWFDENQSGTLTTKLSDNLERIKEGIGDKFGLLIQYSTQFFAGFIIAFMYSWQMTLVMLALTPLLAGGAAFMSRMIGGATKAEAAMYAVAGAVAEEVLGAIRTVMAFNGQKHESGRYETQLLKGQVEGIKKSLFTGFGLGFVFMVMFFSYGLAFWYGSTLILSGIIERGTVFTVLFAVMMGSMSLGNAGPQLANLAIARGAAAAIYAIIDRTPDIDPYDEGGKKPPKPNGRIEFKRVDFAYPTRSEVKVLKEVSFSVEPGEKVAIVGASGCGKSTIVNLLLRYYDIASGAIAIDGDELRTLNVRWLRKTIGVVSQEPVLFETTVEDNIRMGNRRVSGEQIKSAAKQANAHEFITKLPMGYKTSTGERGTQLSGGQKQRVAIARALVRDPKILLLDEATSALDAHSEALVQQALDKAQQGRTTIIIAHRLSTIRNADKIIALQDGEIAETGTHSELMKLGGVYQQLVTSQTFTDATADAAVASDYGTAADTTEAELGNGDTNGQAGDVSSEAASLQGQSPTSATRAKRLSSAKSGSVKRRLSTPARTRTISGSSGVSSASSKRRKSTLFAKQKESPLQKLKHDLKLEGAQRSSMRDILRWSRPEVPFMIIGLLIALLRGTIMPAFSFFFSGIFEAFTKSGDELKATALFWALMFIGLGLLEAVTTLAMSYMFGLVGERLTKRMRMAVFDNVLRQDASYFDDPKHSTGKICTRLATDAPNIRAAVDFRLGNVLSAVMSLMLGMFLAFFYGWQLALIVILLLPLVAFGGAVRMKMRHKGAASDAALLEEAGRVAADAIENIRTVQSLTRERTFQEMFEEQLLLPYKEALKQAQIQAISFAFAQSIFFFMYAISFGFGAFLVSMHDMTPIQVYRVFFAINFSGMVIGFATTYFPEYMKATFSAGLILKMANVVPEIDSMSEEGEKPEISGQISFNSVFFNYPMRMDVDVLQGLNFELEPGRTLALVGASGCGKSTAITLIERYYDPLRGAVQVDGLDVRGLNVRHLRASIALVAQEPTLFDCSIQENIGYGLEPPPQPDHIYAAAKEANIHDFVVALPQGYETRVGERGAQLSGGQKQRIAIARALVRNPRILLLDEATSALDTESEKVVQEALDRARQGRTCIVVAHRLSTVQACDSIAVLTDGTVVELGTHAELLAKQGAYYDLISRQNVNQDALANAL